MALSSKTASKTYLGDGVNTIFDTSFPVWKEGEAGQALIAVILHDPEGIFSVTTNYTTSDLAEGKIRIHYPKAGDPLPEGWRLTVIRDMDFLQTKDIPNNSPFLAEVVVQALDKLTAQDQQLLEAVNRSVKIQPGSEDNPDEIIKSIHNAVAIAQEAKLSAQHSQESAEDSAEQAEQAKDDAQAIVDAASKSVLPAGAKEDQILVMGSKKLGWKDVKDSLPGGKTGQKLVKQANGTTEWEDLYGVPEGGENGQVLVRREGNVAQWGDLLPKGFSPGLRNVVLSGRMKDGLPAYLVGPELINMEHELGAKISKVGTVSASAIYGTGYTEVHPLRNQIVWNTTGWLTPNGQRSGWWQYEFATEHVLAGMFMLPYENSEGQGVKDWELQGWDGTKWVTIYARANDQGQRGYNSAEKTHGRMYWFTENTTTYKKIRVNISDVIGDSTNRINIAALRFYEAVIPGQHKYDVVLYASDDTPFKASIACGHDQDGRPQENHVILTKPVNFDGAKFAEMSRNYMYLVPAQDDGSLPSNLDANKAVKIEGQNAYIYTDTRKMHYGTVNSIEKESLAILQSTHEIDCNPVPDGIFEHELGAFGYGLRFGGMNIHTTEKHRGSKSSYHFNGTGIIQVDPLMDQAVRGKHYHPYGQEFTFEVDLKWNGPSENATDSIYTIFDTGYYHGKQSKGLVIHYHNRKKIISLRWNIGDSYYVPCDLSDGKWHTLAVSKSHDKLHIHVDGKLLCSFDGVPDVKNAAKVWILGRWWHHSSGYWSGYMNNMRYTLGTALYQGADYEVSAQFSTSLIPHRTLRYDHEEGVVKEWDTFTEKWTATPMLPLGHVDTGRKEHLLTDQPRGTNHLKNTKYVLSDKYESSANYTANYTPACVFNFGDHSYNYSTPADALTVDHFVQFGLEKPMAFERMLTCNVLFDWRAHPVKFALKASKDEGKTWMTLIDRLDNEKALSGGGAPQTITYPNAASHHLGFYKTYTITDTTKYDLYRLELPNKTGLKWYGDYAHTTVQLMLTFSGAKPEVESICSYATGGYVSMGPIAIENNQVYNIPLPFGGAPFDVIGEVEEENDQEQKRRKLGQPMAATNGEVVYLAPDALVIHTGTTNLSIGTNTPDVALASTKANLYITAKRRV